MFNGTPKRKSHVLAWAHLQEPSLQGQPRHAQKLQMLAGAQQGMGIIQGFGDEPRHIALKETKLVTVYGGPRNASR